MLKISIEVYLNSKNFMYNNFLVLGLSKPNLWLEIEFWLNLIIYTGRIITQSKKGYWNDNKELNFPTSKLKIHTDWILQKIT